jgi:hypothetical protein
MDTFASDRAFAARIAYLRRKADFHFERSKEHYRRWRLKAKYDPNQPRIPAGQPGGGRWRDGDGSTEAFGLARDVAQVDERVLAQARVPREREERCKDQYDADFRLCARIRPPPRQLLCREQAGFRYAACLRNDVIPPFPYADELRGGRGRR